MDNYIDIVMIIAVVGIVLLLVWRPILKLISIFNPRLYLWINRFNASTPITDEYIRNAYKKKDSQNGQ